MIAITLAACATVTSASAGPTAGLSGVAQVGGLTVRPLRIVEDSRCPVNVVCVWQGRLRIKAEVDAVGGSEEYRLILTLREPAMLGGGTLTMVEAAPVKLDAPIEPGAYRFTFTFEGGL